MVRIKKGSRQGSSPFLQSNKIFIRHIFLLAVVALLGLAGSVYAFLLNQEGKDLTRMQGRSSVLRTGMAHASAASLVSKPFIMYGTAWKEQETARHVQQAVMTGFRFIDTACQPKHYNEAGVGAGWQAAASELGLKREG